MIKPAQSQTRGQLFTFLSLASLFLAWGFITSMNDPLIPAVRAVFELSYAESLLTQFAFFIAYGLFSIPAGRLLHRVGYGTSIVLALLAMIVGCLCMPLATELESYAFVLFALFVVASGMTLLQVAANPLVASLGSLEHAHFRLTLTQAFNSLGTVLGPWVGAALMLQGGVFGGSAASGGSATSSVGRTESLGNIDFAYFCMAAMLVLLMVFVWRIRGRLVPERALAKVAHHATGILKSRWAWFGAAAIFAYVGAEVAIASLMINFLHQPDVLGVSLVRAGALLGIVYWGGAMCGRFVGSVVLSRYPAPRLLAIAALTALALCTLVAGSHGAVAAVAALSIGLFNSIMFPVIFTVTLERSSATLQSTSGLLCTAIIGGALLPPVAGLVADATGLHAAFVVPAVAYGLIAWFAVAAARFKLSTTALAPTIG